MTGEPITVHIDLKGGSADAYGFLSSLKEEVDQPVRLAFLAESDSVWQSAATLAVEIDGNIARHRIVLNQDGTWMIRTSLEI